MESSYPGIDLLNTCLRTRLPENVNYACMSATGRYHQAFIANIDDNRLVIIDPRIRLPGSIDLRLLILQSLLKIRGTLDLSCNKQFAIDHKRWATFNQELYSLSFKVMQ